MAARSPADAVDDAVTALAFGNPDVFDDSFRRVIPDTRWSAAGARRLIITVDEIPLDNRSGEPDDVMGPVYEQVVTTLADLHAQGGRRRAVSRPPDGPARGPALRRFGLRPLAGSGSLLTAAAAYVADRTGRVGDLELYEQDVNRDEYTTARLNLMLHGNAHPTVLSGDVMTGPRHLTADGDMRRFDRVLTHPPFAVRYESEKAGFLQQARYGSEPGCRPDVRPARPGVTHRRRRRCRPRPDWRLVPGWGRGVHPPRNNQRRPDRRCDRHRAPSLRHLGAGRRARAPRRGSNPGRRARRAVHRCRARGRCDAVTRPACPAPRGEDRGYLPHAPGGPSLLAVGDDRGDRRQGVHPERRQLRRTTTPDSREN